MRPSAAGEDGFRLTWREGRSSSESTLRDLRLSPQLPDAHSACTVYAQYRDQCVGRVAGVKCGQNYTVGIRRNVERQTM